MAQGPITQLAYGFQGYVQVFPEPIVTNRNPVNGSDTAQNGQIWINTSGGDAFVMVNSATSTWLGIGGGAGVFQNLTVNPGPTALTGQFTLVAGGQATQIANDAAANTVTLGSTNTTSTTTVQSGTGGAFVTSTGLNTVSSSRANNNAVNITASNAAGGIVESAANATIVHSMLAAGATYALTNLPFTMTSGTGTIAISNDATANTLDLGTGAGAKTIAIGSTTGGSTTINTPTATGLHITNAEATTCSIFVGTADPNGSLAGTDGSIFLRSGTGTASTVLYVCTGGTTWTAVTVP